MNYSFDFQLVSLTGSQFTLFEFLPNVGAISIYNTKLTELRSEAVISFHYPLD